MRKNLHHSFINAENARSVNRVQAVVTALKSIALICIFTLLSGMTAFADYTVASGTTVEAATIAGQSGVLTVNGRLNLTTNVSLLGFTSVIINAPGGQIYWTTNCDLTFAANTTIVINNSAPGLQPTSGNGNASQRLIVGTTIISVSSDNAQNAAFSFEQFNALGGLPQFTLTGNSSVCEGSPINLTITPDRTSTVSYTYNWSITGSTANFTPAATTSYGAASTSITPGGGNYIITCSVKATGDLLATRTMNVSVNAATMPTATANPSTICAGSTTHLSASSPGSTIKWFTVASGSTAIGTSSAGTNFAVSPLTTTTYYAEAATESGCTNTTRAAVTVTVGSIPSLFTVTGGGSYCSGAPGVAVGLAGSQTGADYQLKLNGLNTGNLVPGTGAALSFGLQDIAGSYTVVATNTASQCAVTMSGSRQVSLYTKPTASITGTQLICKGTSAQVSITVSGSAPFNGTLSNGQEFNGSTSPIIVNVTPSSTLSLTIATLVDATCSATAAGLTGTAILTVGMAGEWRGITTNWHDGQNWCTGAAPTSGVNITIPVTPNNPVISAGTALANNLVIAPGATLNLSGGTLKISGSITSSQAIVVTDGTIEMNGTSSQAIAGSNFSGNSLKNLTVNNATSVVVSNSANDSLKISGALAFGNVNNATMYTGNNIILTSTSKGTARVADITNKGVNTGNRFDGKVVVERYFPARRAWRLFTAPLSGAGSIFDNWQNKGNYKQGVGTFITGTNATNPIGPDGLDWSSLNNSSLKAGVNLSSVTNTRTTLLSKNLADTSDNIPYFIFVRGDRNQANTIPSSSNNTTLSSTGKLQTGRQTFTASASLNGYTLVGNPYASPVDFDSLVRRNVVKRFYVWDPYLNAEQGGYVLLDDYDENGVYTVSPASPGGMNKILQSGQAFFVQTASNNPASIIFQETAKSVANANLTAFRPLGNVASFRASLLNTNSNNALQLLDGVYAEFDNSFNKEVDVQDAFKLGNVKEMLAIQRNENNLTIERRPTLSTDDTLFLVLTKTTQRNYEFEFEPTGLDPLLSVILVDNYTGAKTVLSAVAKSSVRFDINTDAASADPSRFKIVFRQAPAVDAPVRFREVIATPVKEQVVIDWTIENEMNVTSYRVDKSADGIHFSGTHMTIAKGSMTTASYQWVDQAPVTGNNYYRIVSTSKDGKFQYSKTVSVNMQKTAGSLRVYPNPVNDGIIGIEFCNLPGGIYKTRLINSVGQTMLHQQITHAAGTTKEYIRPSFKLLAGMYQLEIAGPGNTITAVKLVVR